MSVRVSALCWKVPLPATEKLVLQRLADFADDQGFNIYPAVQTVADDCGIGIRIVQLTLKKMVSKGILVVMNQGGGRGRATEYAIDMDLIRQLRDAPPAASHQYNGHAEKGAKGVNSEPRSPFTGVNPESDDINPAPDSPHPLDPSEEEGGGTGAREIAVLVGGLTGLPATTANVATVEDWLAKGYHPQQDIYPAVVEALPTAKNGFSVFAYFTKAIHRHHTARTAPPSNIAYLPRAAGGRQAPSDTMSAGAQDLMAALTDPNFTYRVGR
jgi:hypothetical protein